MLSSLGRKLDLREMKVLQKEEHREYQNLVRKTQAAKENLDRQVTITLWRVSLGSSGL